MQSPKALLSTAESAVRAAGALLRSQMAGAQKVLSAQGKDIKLQADQDAEAVILEALRAVAPYPVLAEESGLTDLGASASGAGAAEGQLPAGRVWIVDPLDGTFNYDRGLPLCCVSIGLWEDGEPVLGVVYDFNRDELFSGIVAKGSESGGAWLNGQPMHASRVTDIGKAALATGFPVARDFGDESLKRFITQIQKFKKQRLIGTAALAMAYTACGRVDAYFEEGGRLWDVGAGIALIRAAGGVVEFRAVGPKPWMVDVAGAGTRELVGHVSAFS